MALKMQAEFGDDLNILFVERQGASPEQMEQFVWNKKWFNDHSIWTNESPFENGMSGLPNATLLGVDGEVLWSGRPTSEHGTVSELIAAQMKLAKKGPKDLSPACAKAWSEFDKGNQAAALDLLAKAPEAEKEAAARLAKSLETRAKAQLRRLEWLIESAEFEHADKLAPQLVKGFAGNQEYEEEAKALAEKLAAKEMAPEREAAKAFDKVEKLIAKNGLDATVIKQLKGLSERFPNSRAAKRAGRLAKVAEGA